MKKLIFILIFLLILLVLIITNPQKQIDLDIKELEAQTGLTVEEFKTKMESMEGYDYYVTEPRNVSETETSCTAYDRNGDIFIDFCKYSNETEAKKALDFCKSVFENGEGNIEINEKFKCAAINSEDKYFIVSIVGDTLLMVSDTDSQNKLEVTEIFNNLGY